MKKLLILFTIASTINSFGQETVRIKQKKIYDWGTPYPKHKEIFHVLKSNNNTKHGLYTLKAGRKVIAEGWYKNDLKDSIWIYRQTGGYNNYISSRGYYENDEKIGVWEYFNKDGLEQKYDYLFDSLIFTNIEYNDTIIPVWKENNFTLNKVDSPPIFKEGKSAEKYYIRQANHFFGYNIPQNVWIIAIVQFEIDDYGETHNHTIIEGDYPEYNDNALQVVKSIPDEWIPAKINGKPVKSLWTITMKNKYKIK